MHSIQKLSVATPHTIRQELLQTVEELLLMIRHSVEVLKELQEVRNQLDALPLASDDYSTAANRLRNAHRYLVSQERGAARYELQLLAGSLRNGYARQAADRPWMRQIDNH